MPSAGGQRATFAGSCAEYEWSEGILSEATTPLIPATYYGACKNALRDVAEGFAARRGVSFSWGRIFFVYGPHEHPDRLVSSLARALVRGEPAPTSEGSQRRDFLYAEDVADAFVALLDSERGGRRSTSAPARRVPVRDVVAAVAAAAGRPDLVQWGALPQRPGDPPLLEADVRRLREEVGWRPSVPLDEGIARTVEWWKTNAEPAGGTSLDSPDRLDTRRRCGDPRRRAAARGIRAAALRWRWPRRRC